MSAPARDADRRAHWDRVHASRPPHEASWYEARPGASLALIDAAGLPAGARALDVGAGVSSLAGHLLDRGLRVGVLDVSAEAIARARRQLGERAASVQWFETDVAGFRSPHPWELWHDRAALHFLVEERDRAAYREALLGALAPGGHAVIATFGPDGPRSCSGLPVRRYDVDALARLLGEELRLREHRLEEHRTPAGATQQFLYGRFERVPPAG